MALTTPVIDDDAAWLKYPLARSKQTLPDWEGRLPVQQSCPHPNPCHSCPHFPTDGRYRPVLQEQLEPAEQPIGDAERAGHERLRRSTVERLESARDHCRAGPAGRVSQAQPERLAASQRRRSAQRRSSVTAAIAKHDRAAQPVTVVGVAALAGVDRSYIYSQDDPLAEIRRRRTIEPAKRARRPVVGRATVASLQARLANAHDEIARLKAENRAIREPLSARLGRPSAPPGADNRLRFLRNGADLYV